MLNLRNASGASCLEKIVGHFKVLVKNLIYESDVELKIINFDSIVAYAKSIKHIGKFPLNMHSFTNLQHF